jgi:uncharacterized protein
MRLPVDKITEDGLELLLRGDEDFLGESRDRLTVDEHLTIDPNVRGRLRLEGGEGDIRLTGRIWGRVGLQCARCLVGFASEVEVDLDFLLRRGEDEETAEETEMTAALDSTVRILEDEIDLDDIIIQELLLAVPMKPLCREDCPGLCPHCGALRGSPECSCPERTAVDPRWAALVKIKETLKK